MTRQSIRLAILFLFAAELCLAQQPAPVRVEQGLVQGASEDGLTVYQHLNPGSPRTSRADLDISDAVSTYWVNFARHGDPNGDGVPAWPAFSDTNPRVMHFNQTPRPGPVPSAESLRVLDAYFAWRRTPEGEAWAQ